HISVDFIFFQAEDGIRARNVTGVQTCALPITAKLSPDHIHLRPEGSLFIMESAEFHEWLDAEIHRLDREVADRVVDAPVLGAHGVIEHARNDAISEIRRSAGKMADDEKLKKDTKRKIITDLSQPKRSPGTSMGEVWLTKYGRGLSK